MNYFSKTTLSTIFVLLFAGVGFDFANPASAVNYYWVGGTNGANTNTAANWSTISVFCTAGGNGTVPTSV